MNIKVSLPGELLEFVEEKVRSGEYASSDDVIGEALRVLEARSWIENFDSASLRAAWREGMESGEFEELDLDQIAEEGRKLLRVDG